MFLIETPSKPPRGEAIIVSTPLPHREGPGESLLFTGRPRGRVFFFLQGGSWGRPVFYYKFREQPKLLVPLFQHFNHMVQPLHMLPSAVVPDDERHLQLRVLLQVVELPRMEVRHEIPVVLQRPPHQPFIQP